MSYLSSIFSSFPAPSFLLIDQDLWVWSGSKYEQILLKCSWHANTKYFHSLWIYNIFITRKVFLKSLIKMPHWDDVSLFSFLYIISVSVPPPQKASIFHLCVLMCQELGTVRKWDSIVWSVLLYSLTVSGTMMIERRKRRVWRGSQRW